MIISNFFNLVEEQEVEEVEDRHTVEEEELLQEVIEEHLGFS